MTIIILSLFQISPRRSFRYVFATQIPPKTKCLEAYRVYMHHIPRQIEWKSQKSKQFPSGTAMKLWKLAEKRRTVSRTSLKIPYGHRVIQAAMPRKGPEIDVFLDILLMATRNLARKPVWGKKQFEGKGIGTIPILYYGKKDVQKSVFFWTINSICSSIFEKNNRIHQLTRWTSRHMGHRISGGLAVASWTGETSMYSQKSPSWLAKSTATKNAGIWTPRS